MKLAARRGVGAMMVAQILLPTCTPTAAPARREERRHHMVAGLHVPHAGADFLHDASPFVATDDGQRHGKIAGADMMI